MALDKFLDDDLEYIDITATEKEPVNEDDLPEVVDALKTERKESI